MIASDIINLILQQYKMLCAKYPQTPSFIPNTKGDSFYLISNRGEGLHPTQIRLSNHGTYLETWCDRNELGDSVERLNPAFWVNIYIAAQLFVGSIARSTMIISPSSNAASTIETPLTRKKNVDALCLTSNLIRSNFSRISSAGEGNPALTSPSR